MLNDACNYLLGVHFWLTIADGQTDIHTDRQTRTDFVFVCRLGISLITWLLHTPYKFHHPIPPNIISVPPHYLSYQQICTYRQLLNTQSPYLAVHLISVIAQSLQPPHQWYHPVHPSHQYLNPIATSEHVPTPNPSIHPISAYQSLHQGWATPTGARDLLW